MTRGQPTTDANPLLSALIQHKGRADLTMKALERLRVEAIDQRIRGRLVGGVATFQQRVGIESVVVDAEVFKGHLYGGWVDWAEVDVRVSALLEQYPELRVTNSDVGGGA